MQTLAAPSMSFDALRHLRRPTDKPTHEEIEELRRSGIVWLKWKPSLRQNEEENNAAMAALEELARVRLISYVAWIDAVTELWPKEITQLERLHGDNKFQLGVDFATSDPDLFTKFSAKFLEMKGQDATGPRTEEKQVSAHVMLLSIPVRLTLLGTTHFSITPFNVLWEKACGLVEAARDLVLTSDGSEPLYRIVDIKVSKYSVGRWCADNVARFYRLASCGLRVWCPLEPSRTSMSKYVDPSLIKPLQELLATQVSPLSNDGFRALSSIRVSLLSDHQLLDSLFSTTMASQSIRDVAVSDPSVMRRGSRQRAWQWLAVVLRLPIDSFTLDCQNMLIEDVEVLEASLKAPDPLTVLFPSCRRLFASASLFHLHSPSNASDDADTFQSEQPLVNLHVVGVNDTADGWVTLLLPGWGRAWVSSTDASLAAAPEPLTEPCGPAHISLTNLRNDQAPTVLAFLQQMRQNVRKISLSSSKRHETHVNVSSILESVFLACPVLEELHIDGMALPSLELISKLFQQGSCRVKHLVLENIHIEDKTTTAVFFDHLGDANHPIMEHLRTLFFTTQDKVELFPFIQPAALQMLQRNNRLYDFHLEVGDVRYALRLDDTIPAKAYDQFNGQRIVDRLLLPNKLAFLSVVLADGDSSGAQPRSAMHKFDRNVLTTIFQLAGVAHTRCVWVQFC